MLLQSVFVKSIDDIMYNMSLRDLPPFISLYILNTHIFSTTQTLCVFVRSFEGDAGKKKDYLLFKIVCCFFNHYYYYEMDFQEQQQNSVSSNMSPQEKKRKKEPQQAVCQIF